MKSSAKCGIIVFIFTCVFLILFPAFLDRWPTIFGIASTFLFIPQYMERKEKSLRHGLSVSILICIVNITLILIFCERSLWKYQISYYLSAYIACMIALCFKRMIEKLR